MTWWPLEGEVLFAGYLPSESAPQSNPIPCPRTHESHKRGGQVYNNLSHDSVHLNSPFDVFAMAKGWTAEVLFKVHGIC